MALTFTLLTEDTNDSSANDRSTASISPGANKLILAFVYSSDVFSNPAAHTASGNGLTWVQVANESTDTSSGRLTVLRAMGASPSSGAVTFSTSGTPDSWLWAVYEVGGVNITGDNGENAVRNAATDEGSSTAPAVALGAFASANNGTMLVISSVAQGTIPAVGSGFTSGSGQASDNDSMRVGYRTDNDTSVNGTTASGRWGIIGFEIVAGSTVHELAVGGSLAPAGALSSQVSVTFSGAIGTITGSLSHRPSVSFSGSLTPAGALTKVVATTFSGVVGLAGSLVTAALVFLNLAGSIVPTGAVTWLVKLVPSGSLTPTGAIAWVLSVSRSGSLAPVGTLTKVVSQTYAGSVGLAGTLTKNAAKALSGALTPVGTMGSWLISKALSGSLTPTGSLSHLLSVSFSGAVGLAGTLTKVIPLAFAGALAPAGALVRVVNKVVAGTLGPAGAVSWLVSKTLSGAITPTGALSKVVNLSMSGAVSLLGVLSMLVDTGIKGFLSILDRRSGNTGVSDTRSGNTSLSDRSAASGGISDAPSGGVTATNAGSGGLSIEDE